MWVCEKVGGNVWESVWGECGGCGEVCWGVGKVMWGEAWGVGEGKGRCGWSEEVWGRCGRVCGGGEGRCGERCGV